MLKIVNLSLSNSKVILMFEVDETTVIQSNLLPAYIVENDGGCGEVIQSVAYRAAFQDAYPKYVQ